MDDLIVDITKNHSFIMDRSGQWRLAPAYDLCYSYNPQGRISLPKKPE